VWVGIHPDSDEADRGADAARNAEGHFAGTVRASSAVIAARILTNTASGPDCRSRLIAIAIEATGMSRQARKNSAAGTTIATCSKKLRLTVK
jgi:hypothetical protein